MTGNQLFLKRIASASCAILAAVGRSAAFLTPGSSRAEFPMVNYQIALANVEGIQRMIPAPAPTPRLLDQR